MLFETLKYAKLNYPLGKFVGIFYWEKVGQDLLLEKALWQEFLPIWRLVRNEAFSLAGRRSEERVVCSQYGCRCRDFKKCPMFDAFCFVVLVIRKMWQLQKVSHEFWGLMLTPVSLLLRGVFVQPEAIQDSWGSSVCSQQQKRC